uniref:Uncharacterized protein n=1 Tax=Varanus komodoensis TaxID=61221 RepID=A0A8D2IR26_VARKO
MVERTSRSVDSDQLLGVSCKELVRPHCTHQGQEVGRVPPCKQHSPKAPAEGRGGGPAVGTPEAAKAHLCDAIPLLQTVGGMAGVDRGSKCATGGSPARDENFGGGGEGAGPNAKQ